MSRSRPLQALGIVAALLIAAGSAFSSDSFTVFDGMIVAGMLVVAVGLAIEFHRGR